MGRLTHLASSTGPTFDRLVELTAGWPDELRVDFFELLPPEVQDAMWAALASECALHTEQSRLADPDPVEWHRRARVGRRWGTRPSALRPSRVTSRSSKPSRGDDERSRDDPIADVPPPIYFAALADCDVPATGGMVRCPVHDDRTPSCRVYAEPERGWYCHGCHIGGSVYDLAATLWGLETRGDEFRLLRARIARALLMEVVA